MKLYREEKPVIILDDVAYTYRNDFRTFLKINAVIKDDEILEEDKVDFINSTLFNGQAGKNTVKLYKMYMDTYTTGGKQGKRAFDLEQDAPYIYASFWQCYHIDLFSAELTTEQFLALLRGLPKGCRLTEIVEIRQMDVPPANKNNTKQRQAILKAKQSVALQDDENQNPFKSFGQTIAGLAEMNNGG